MIGGRRKALPDAVVATNPGPGEYGLFNGFNAEMTRNPIPV